MAQKVDESDFGEIVSVFNTNGRKAALQYIREKFDMNYPGTVLKRIENSSEYSYDKSSRQFIINACNDGSELFLSMDELCGKSAKASTIGTHTDAQREAALERLTRDLIKDRLLELSKYIMLDSVSRTIIIDRTSITADGYKIVTH